MESSEKLTNENDEREKGTTSSGRGNYKRSTQTSPVSVAQGKCTGHRIASATEGPSKRTACSNFSRLRFTSCVSTRVARCRKGQ